MKFSVNNNFLCVYNIQFMLFPGLMEILKDTYKVIQDPPVNTTMFLLRNHRHRLPHNTPNRHNSTVRSNLTNRGNLQDNLPVDEMVCLNVPNIIQAISRFHILLSYYYT